MLRTGVIKNIESAVLSYLNDLSPLLSNPAASWSGLIVPTLLGHRERSLEFLKCYRALQDYLTPLSPLTIDSMRLLKRIVTQKGSRRWTFYNILF